MLSPLEAVEDGNTSQTQRSMEAVCIQGPLCRYGPVDEDPCPFCFLLVGEQGIRHARNRSRRDPQQEAKETR